MHLFTSVLGKYFLLSHRGWGLFSTKGLILENIFHNSLSQKFTILPPSTDQVPTKYRPSTDQARHKSLLYMRQMWFLTSISYIPIRVLGIIPEGITYLIGYKNPSVVFFYGTSEVGRFTKTTLWWLFYTLCSKIRVNDC